MANPTNEEFINRIMQAESGGRRYDKNGKLLEGPKTRTQGTGKGEMQVVDKTNLDPGFGVTPAKNKSPDERARVGKDYAQAMLDRYNNQQHAAMAYNWGPGNVDKWLAKGQAAPIPKETADYVVKVTGSPIGGQQQVAKKASPFDTAAAPAPAAAAGAPKAPAPPPIRKAETAPTQDMKARIAALGPNYHAAMALSYLADNTDEDDPTIQAYRERMGEESERSAFLSEPAAPVALAGVDLKASSPFQEPVTAARGGLIHRAKGSPEEGETGYFQDPMGVADSGPVTADTRAPGKAPSARAMLDMVKEVGSGAARNVKNLAIGASDTPYDLVGGPVDLATMAMRPFGYKTEKPVGGSEYLKEKATELGVRLPDSKDSRDQGFRLAGELGASLVNPASVVRGGLKAGAKAADMLRKATTAAPVEQAPVAAASLSAMATKKGATSMPFYSPLDQYAQTLTGPVSGEEFIKQLQNKGFRAYDVERAKEAMQNLGSGKVTPSQVMGALDETYHPESFITKIEEPGSVWDTYPDTDNVYYRGSKSPPMGVISLHLPITDEIRQGRDLKNKLNFITNRTLGLQDFSKKFENLGKFEGPDSIEKTAKLAFDLAETQYGHGSQLVRNAQRSFELIKNAQKDMVPYLDQIPEYLQLKNQFQYPLAYGDPVRFSRLVDIKVKEGKSLDEVGDVAEDLRREAGAKILNFFDKVGAGIPQRSNSIFKDVARAEDPLINDPYKKGYASNMEMEFGEAEHIINREIRQFQREIHDDVSKLIESIPESLSPAVGHGDLFKNNMEEANPIAFSRFIDQSGYINQQKMDGMYVPELQSDLFKDIKSRGTQGQSPGNDLPKITKLTEEKNALEIQLEEARAARDKLDTRSPVDGSGHLGQGWAEASNKVTALRNKVGDKEEAITKIREKVYDVTPAFAGMENSPQVVQQLAAKNAVIAGIQRGKSFVAFPGAESDQAQLYEKLPRNLDQIIKDLGPGFVRQIVELPLPDGVHYKKLGQMISAGTVKYPTDARGMPLTNEPGRMLSEAIVWNPEAAARILKQGVRFSHGGSVERRPDDNRRYL